MNTNNQKDRTISILDAVNTTGNITKAAEDLFLTQPYVTKSIRKLEKNITSLLLTDLIIH